MDKRSWWSCFHLVRWNVVPSSVEHGEIRVQHLDLEFDIVELSRSEASFANIVSHSFLRRVADINSELLGEKLGRSTYGSVNHLF